ncbi:MAG: hypothetical protein FK734_11250 [Asgard group archaeon]|nr:hypothetical protein [Asgard group archaeon]
MGFFKKIFPGKKGKDSNIIRKSTSIEEFRAPSEIKEGQILKINVKGHFSNLSWELDKVTAEVIGNRILVTVMGKKEAGMMAAQALKPYETITEIKGLKKGKYIIKAEKGPAKTIDIIVIG